jgi:hypothetical protein
LWISRFREKYKRDYGKSLLCYISQLLNFTEWTDAGKAFAPLIDDAEKQDLKKKVVLFWNTYNSKDFSDILTTVDYHQLPRYFHRYFENEVQPLDRNSCKKIIQNIAEYFLFTLKICETTVDFLRKQMI